jgi:Protein of unknown function (DUF1553)/Protein of unknown function (DUF1549)/Planctomycete cytochrome C/Concanavalin A-like lectin/glucanases superfamily
MVGVACGASRTAQPDLDSSPVTVVVRRCVLPAVVLVALGPLLAQAPSTGAAAGDHEVRFHRDVRPILAAACFACHGPDPASRKAELRFDREADFFAARENGFVVVRGKPVESLLHQRITATDQDEVMPPPDAHVQLDDGQKQTLRRWIEQGAPWQKHWAFLAPERPATPAVAETGWVRNPIDAFILARLEAAGLQPAREAGRRTLARRVSLDLTGLPPSPERVEAFVADPREDAYEHLVDELLASPHYGEHRARYWLDAARYADTHGIHFDNYREMWPYRDWVIDAFQQNQRFDRFTIEQIAGDLLPAPTESQRIATGFHRCNTTTNEGGTIEEENLAGYARDRVETTAWVWLGLTANCAVCHDHKFDPIPQRDFYAMSAYFRNTTQKALDGNVKDSAPILRIPKAADRERAASLAEQIRTTKAERDQLQQETRRRFDAWLSTATVDSWARELAQDLDPAQRLPLIGPAAEAVAGAGERAGVTTPLATPATAVAWDASGPFGPATTVDRWSDLDGAAAFGAFTNDQPASVSAWVKVAEDAPEGAILGRMDDDAGCRGWNLWLQGGEFTVHVIHRWPDDALKVRTKGGQVKRGTWQHVCFVYDGSGQATGIRIHVDGRRSSVEVEANTLQGTIRSAAGFGLAPTKATAIQAALSSGAADGPEGYVRCAREGESLVLREARDVAYGARGRFRFLAGRSGTVTFDNATFGDPIPGVAKVGYFKTASGPAGLASRVSVQQLLFFDRALTADAIARQAVAITVRTLLATPPAQREAGAIEPLYGILSDADASTTAVGTRLQALEQESRELDQRSPVTHVQEEREGAAMAFVLVRGEYDKRGEQVEPGVFSALHALAPAAPKNRLGLAQWLVAPDNPLTPRVIVNRLWQEVFGTGIVRSSEDFGIMGDAPSHPELLDWLATEFRSDWDYRRMLRLIVTSATYRQAAVATPAKIEADPANRLLSRGPRFRMDAEVIRDQALGVSGLLVPTIGGPSVKPYQPEGVWEAVGMRESNTKSYVQDHGDALYRRSLYSFWKRMAPPASLELLNATNREVSCLRRERTNTPMQALVTLNDPQFVEAARVLAERVLQQAPDAPLAEAGRRTLLRPLTAAELAILVESHTGLLAHYRANDAEARALIAVGERRAEATLPPAELAAMTMVCNQLLNLDEVLNK